MTLNDSKAIIYALKFSGKIRSTGVVWESDKIGMSGGSEANVDWGDGNCLTGFHGKSGTYIDSIGFIYEKIGP